MVIPAVAFEQATIEEAIEFLRVKSKELDTTTSDPKRKGVNFILQLPLQRHRHRRSTPLI